MSNENKKKKTITLEITISEAVYIRLKSQLTLFKRMGIPELCELKDVSELIAFLLDQLTISKADAEDFKEKFESGLKSLSEGDITLEKFFEKVGEGVNSKNKKKKNDSSDENEGWDIEEGGEVEE